MIEFQCKAYGVDQQRDGICYLLSTQQHRLLLDCGLYDPFELLVDLQNWVNQTTQPPLSGIICSHAHQDHVHSLLHIHQTYPDVPIFISQATAVLLSFHWSSSKFSSLKKAFIPLPWRSPFNIDDSLSIEFIPAGHLPGAASSLIEYSPQSEDGLTQAETSRILYSGDFCLSNSRLTDGLPLQSYRNLSPDFLLIDATFGNEKSPNRRYQEHQLISSIEEDLKKNSNVAIAASPLGQAQEIILLLKNHPIFSKGNIQVWLDNSIAKACDLFEQILAELPGRVKNFAKTQALFLESRISPQVRVFDKKTLLEESDTPSIFISTPAEIQDSLHQVLIGNWHCYWPIIHPNHFETDPSHLKDIQQLEQNLLSSAASTQAETNVTVSCYQLHQHSDVQGTLQLIHNLKPQHVAFSHGTNETTADLCGLDELINRYHLHLPQKGKTLEIMVAKNQLRSEAPPLTEMMLEGELSETPREVQIHLPDSIKTDSRWDAIADSGIILATWQGENLVIKGVSQRELINAQLHPKANSGNTCFHCSDYQNFVCQQMASPLFALKVTPEGSCQFFTAKEISQ